MRPHPTDIHLERVRLALAAGDRDSARTYLDAAAKLVQETGCHGRAAELAALERALARLPAIDRLFALCPRIETARTALRPLSEADAPALLAIYSDAEAMRFRANPPLATLADAEAMVRKAHGLQAEKQSVRWAITDRGSQTLIGTFLVMISPSPHERAEIGYSLARERWGRGLATEVAREMVQYCFDALQLDMLLARTWEANEASTKLLQRLGFERIHHGDNGGLTYRLTRDLWQRVISASSGSGR